MEAPAAAGLELLKLPAVGATLGSAAGAISHQAAEGLANQRRSQHVCVGVCERHKAAIVAAGVCMSQPGFSRRSGEQ